MKICVICNTPIPDTAHSWITHPGDCQRERKRQTQRKWRESIDHTRRTCEAPDCTKMFTPTSKTQKYCSGVCRNRTTVREHRQRKRRLYQYDCKRCGQQCSSTVQKARFCTEFCRKMWAREQAQAEKRQAEIEATNYDLAPDVAVFLASRENGDFPAARAYIQAHPELIAA